MYADTSFLVSLYVADVHSPEAERRVRQFAPEIFLTPLTEVELVNALQLRIFRGESSTEEIRASSSDLDSDIRGGVFTAVPMPTDAYDLARRISVKKAAAIGVRTLDIVHVACATLLQADEFWTFDVRQAELAKVQGLKRR